MRRPATALIVATAALAGCGGDDEEGGEGDSVSVRAGGEARVVGTEYAFDPPNVVVTGAGESAPAEVTLTLDNQGALAHNLKVFQGEEQIGGTPTFPGGRTESGEVRLRPGRYQLVCTVGNHAELGMVGTLEVRAR